jgi:hypothetical protein
MTTFTWKVTAMFTVQQPDPNYVVNVSWVVTGVDGSVTESVAGSTMFDSNQSSTFIPYDQLTEAIVVGWIQANLGTEGVAQYQNIVQGQIDYVLNPPVTPQNTQLPWYVPPTPPAA